jgi:hypothetical protein
MLHEEGSSDHAHSIVHPAGCPQLAHPCIDDGISGPALAPRAEVGIGLRPIAPREGIELGAAGCLAKPRLRKHHVAGEITPSQLFAKLLSSCLRQPMPDEPWGDLTEMKVW